jgi:hypothetical protein
MPKNPFLGTMTTPSGPGGAGLQYRPMSPGRSALGGGLSGLGALLMALGAGQPQQAAAAFQGGLQGFDENQWRQRQQAQQDQLFGMRLEDREIDRAESVEAKAAAVAEKAARDAAIDKLPIDPAMKEALKAGVASYGDAVPKPESTDDITEYNLYKSQGGTEDFTSWTRANKKAGASTSSSIVNMGPTGIDYGDPEKGLVWARNPDQSIKLDERGAPIAIPYQGGPAYIAETDKNRKAEGIETQKVQAANIVTQDIQRALGIIQRSPGTTTGIGGQVLNQVGGTAANDVRALVQTVKANVGFSQLQQMRDNSPTGGALGPVSDAENALLQSVLGNLEQSQTQQQIEENLKRLHDVTLDIVHGPGKGGPRLLGGGGAPQGGGDLKSKYGLE